MACSGLLHIPSRRAIVILTTVREANTTDATDVYKTRLYNAQ
jgi:hypothetical protein